MSAGFWTSDGPSSWSNCNNRMRWLRQRYAHLWGSVKWMDAWQQLDDQTLAPTACTHAYAQAWTHAIWQLRPWRMWTRKRSLQFLWKMIGVASLESMLVFLVARGFWYRPIWISALDWLSHHPNLYTSLSASFLANIFIWINIYVAYKSQQSISSWLGGPARQRLPVVSQHPCGWSPNSTDLHMSTYRYKRHSRAIC